MVAIPPSLLGSLSAHGPFMHLTPHIGTEFTSPTTQLSTLLASSNSDELIRDLAVLVAHRGVVFFRAQDLTVDQQKQLALRLGALTGRPEGHALHRNPVSEDLPELGPETTVFSSETTGSRFRQSQRASNGWHTDISWEPVPSDYAVLKLRTVPRSESGGGGDTLWASAYEAYDRLSPALARFLEGLSAEHDGSFFLAKVKEMGREVRTERGAPGNSITDLRAVHPLVRTHPVTGYKSLYVNRAFTRRILELGADESDAVLDYLGRHVADNHDLQVRFRWERDSVAVWDNRATFHTATYDYDEPRLGHRVTGLGERPYFDPQSKSRREVLAQNASGAEGS